MNLRKVLLKNKLVVLIMENTPLHKYYRKIKMWFIPSSQQLLHTRGADILNRLKIVLDDNSYFFWLDFGTLLGAVRDKAFIKYDSDIDLGMYILDYDSKFDSVLEKAGFRKLTSHHLSSGSNEGLEITYEYNNLKFDIFFYYKKEPNYRSCYSYLYQINKTWTETLATGKYRVLEYRLPDIGFETISFYGEYYNVPKNPHEYLKCLYGENYIFPDPTYNELSSPSVIVYPIEKEFGICRFH